MQKRNQTVSAILFSLISFTPAYAQSMADTAQGMGSMAGVMSACLHDNSGVEKLNKLLETTPQQIRSLMKGYFEAGYNRGLVEVSIYDASDKSWLKIECDYEYVQKKLRPAFDAMMVNGGIR
jgi:hypothetical protein